jgi:hypothetical protein
MCTVLLPPGGFPIAVKYIISYQIEIDHEKNVSVFDADSGHPRARSIPKELHS